MLMAMCDENSLPVVIDGAIESIDPCKYSMLCCCMLFVALKVNLLNLWVMNTSLLQYT